MKEIKRILSLLLVIAMIATMCVTILASCGKEDSTEGPSEQETEAPTTDPGSTEAGKTTYTVTVKSEGGMALEGIDVFIYDGTNIAGYATTGEDGKGTVELPAKSGYIAKIPDDKMPAGYVGSDKGYAFSGTNANVTISSSVVTGEEMPDSFGLGDVMYDFTVTKYNDKKEVTLSKLLKEKEMVLINYWYDGCSYCLEEFPDMETVYQEYKDKIEIVALSPQDNDEDIAAFMKTYENSLPEGGLTFPVAYDDQGIIKRFNPTGAPTSIIIDRYGVICMIVTGATTSYAFRAIYENFTGEDYVQRIIEDPNDLTPRKEPTIQMDDSADIEAAINKGGLKATYTPELDNSDAKYSWPFILCEKNGETFIKASNSYEPNSFATVHIYAEMKAGQALAFDYISSTESGEDIMYVLVNRKPIYEISGNGPEKKTCYPYVATKDGTYEICLLYNKGNNIDVGDDTVYVNNLRLVAASSITEPTYIYRDAATDFKADGSGYDTYVDVVLNPEDGYYHVGTVDGPILLANLMGSTQFSSQTSVWTFAYNNKIVVEGVNYVDQLERYSNYSLNGKIYGYCSVTEELKDLLIKVADCVGIEKGNDNEWLQMCAYYDAYGTDGVELEDPVKGLAIFSAFEATMDEPNEVTYTQIIMPRGLLYRFTPTVSGVYRITSNSTPEGVVSGETHSVEAWIFDKNQDIIYTYEHNEKLWTDTDNVSMVLYMDAGVDYYIDIAYYDVYAAGTFTFDIEYEGETADIFTLASPGYFLMGGEGDDVDSGEIVAGGVQVALGEDGYYHVKNSDGTLGSVLYADFRVTTGLVNVSLYESIALGGFKFNKSALDMDIEAGLANIREENGLSEDAKLTEKDYKQYFIDLWDEYRYEQRRAQIANVNNGIYEEGPDCTAEIKEIVKGLYEKGDKIDGEVIGDELAGCIAVDERLAEILQMYMNTHLFDGVEHSWTKLCFYYKHYGPAV